MVYYFTSFNVKKLRKILQDYAQTTNCPPSEYMNRYVYVDHSPDSVDGEKLSWIVDTFLELQRHAPFLRDVCSKVDSDLSPAEKEYLVIILYATIFKISPSDKDHLYRSIFNLGKSLMRRFSTVFSNNEIIPFISQLAGVHYDDDFITNKIITPLFSWQPYISDMSHDFEYNLQRNSRIRKPASGNMLESVLYRPEQHVMNFKAPDVNSTNAPKKKMLTKSAIDLRLQHISQQNKQTAAKLLNEVKALEFGFAKNKSVKSDTLANVRKVKSRPSAVSKIPKTNADKENILKTARKTAG